jgi:hypothetical protein
MIQQIDLLRKKLRKGVYARQYVLMDYHCPDEVLKRPLSKEQVHGMCINWSGLGWNQPVHFRERPNPKSYSVGSPVQLRVRKLFSFEPLEMKTSTSRKKIHCSIATQFHYRVLKRE